MQSTTMLLAFRVDGTPVSQGSKDFKGMRGGKPVLVESSDAKLRPWRARIAYAGRRAMQRSAPINMPVAVQARFWLPRPASHYGARGLLPSAPTLPAVKPDSDKLGRALLDGLQQGLVLAEDSRVVDLEVRKRYADQDNPPGVDVEIWAVHS